MKNFNLNKDYFDNVFDLLIEKGYSLKSVFNLIANLNDEEILHLVDEELKDMSDDYKNRFDRGSR